MNDHETVMTIGELAAAAGVATPTVRYYEGIGLMPKARRSAAGQRYYGCTELARLIFLRRCRSLGFPVERVRELADLSIRPEADCRKVRDIAAETLAELTVRRKEIQAMEDQLAGFVANCDNACCGGRVRDCVPLAELGDASR